MTMPVQNNHSPDKARFLILHDFPGPGIEALWREFLGRVAFPAHYDTPEFSSSPIGWTTILLLSLLSLTRRLLEF